MAILLPKSVADAAQAQRVGGFGASGSLADAGPAPSAPRITGFAPPTAPGPFVTPRLAPAGPFVAPQTPQGGSTALPPVSPAPVPGGPGATTVGATPQIPVVQPQLRDPLTGQIRYAGSVFGRALGKFNEPGSFIPGGNQIQREIAKAPAVGQFAADDVTTVVGLFGVLACVLGGFVLSHGKILALWQPYEFLIIAGGALGAFIAGNSLATVKASMAGALGLLKGPTYREGDYLDLLSLLHDLFNKIRRDGMLTLESDIESPTESELFNAYPALVKEHHLIEFLTDCLRLMIGGNLDPQELETLLDAELDLHHREREEPSHAVQVMADSLPGFGIVAAVMGIVITMSSLGGGETDQIGEHVAAALVGTFLGILLSYGVAGPIASAMGGRAQEDGKAFECVKVALIATLRGYNPKVAVEFARKTLPARGRPTFLGLAERLKKAH